MTPRAYEASHPWITFDLSVLENALPRFWMLLGEARSKCDHIRYVPLAEDTATRLNQIYFAKGVNATTAIEGNTLSEEQVREHLRGQLNLPLSQEYLGREIDNMIGAYNGITSSVANNEQVPLNAETLCSLNAEILAGLPEEPHVIPGKLREYSVAAGPYVGAPWQDVPYLLDRLCGWLDEIQAPDEDQRIPYALIKAVVAHIYIEWIHPFGNGNGRLGRLIEFFILINSGAPLPAAHVLTSHYNDTRTEYYRQLNMASRNGGDLRAFLLYAAQGLVDGLTGAIKHVHRQQEELMWHAVVDEKFLNRHSPAAQRQRLLAIELGRDGKWVLRQDVRRLSPSLIEAYHGKTTKTLSRDINRLREMQFVQTTAGNRSVRARLDLVRGMRPFVITD